ncbi:MAG: 4-(cytidine 5'-diphospho)-2-C-methyl-D-erythritol kinase [Acidimicrobiales bacterium]
MSTGAAGDPRADGRPTPVEMVAPAKLTLSLKIVGVRPDGYHLLESEMVTLDLADTLVMGEGDGLTVTAASIGGSSRIGERDRPDGDRVPIGPDNLVRRALRAVGRLADVDLVKRVPPGAGLGGGSADAAAVLRWAGCHDPEVALSLGADVPFCLTGGRALVRGVGEDVEPLPYEERAFTLLLLPFGMNTAAVYRAWDGMASPGQSGGETGAAGDGANDLEGPALRVDEHLGRWQRAFAAASGRVPRLAGSGSTWFVEGTLEELGLAGRFLHLGDERARLVEVRTVPAFI